MPDAAPVFISYAREDGSELAKRLVDNLPAHARVKPWQDRNDMQPGNFEDQIRSAIETSRYLVLVLTPGAIRSEWVRREWRLAQKRGVCVLPVKSAPGPEVQEL